MIDQVALFFEGKQDGLVKRLRQEMEQAAENLEFEKAARLLPVQYESAAPDNLLPTPVCSALRKHCAPPAPPIPSPVPVWAPSAWSAMIFPTPRAQRAWLP